MQTLNQKKKKKYEWKKMGTLLIRNKIIASWKAFSYAYKNIIIIYIYTAILFLFNSILFQKY